MSKKASLPTILRVKRKRTDTPLDTLCVEVPSQSAASGAKDAARPSAPKRQATMRAKRNVSAMADALAKISFEADEKREAVDTSKLDSSAWTQTNQAQKPQAAVQPAKPPNRRRVFRRVLSNVNASDRDSDAITQQLLDRASNLKSVTSKPVGRPKRQQLAEDRQSNARRVRLQRLRDVKRHQIRNRENHSPTLSSSASSHSAVHQSHDASQFSLAAGSTAAAADSSFSFSREPKPPQRYGPLFPGKGHEAPAGPRRFRPNVPKGDSESKLKLQVLDFAVVSEDPGASAAAQPKDEDEDQYDYYMMTTEDDVPVDIDADKSLGTVGYIDEDVQELQNFQEDLHNEYSDDENNDADISSDENAPDRDEYEYGGDATSDEDSDPDYRPPRRKRKDNEEYSYDSEPPSSDYDSEPFDEPDEFLHDDAQFEADANVVGQKASGDLFLSCDDIEGCIRAMDDLELERLEKQQEGQQSDSGDMSD